MFQDSSIPWQIIGHGLRPRFCNSPSMHTHIFSQENNNNLDAYHENFICLSFVKSGFHLTMILSNENYYSGSSKKYRKIIQGRGTEFLFEYRPVMVKQNKANSDFDVVFVISILSQFGLARPGRMICHKSVL